MNCLKRKLESERGASILLALLMFLLCMMVGASVLAAAASNAGKARSNRTEQQKYLNLSSAIRLVADEIRQAEYSGKYKVYEWDVTTTTTTPNPGGTPSTTSETDYYFFCEQAEGTYSCGDLTGQLPFGPKLDEIFGKQFEKEDGTDKDGYKSLPVPTPAGQYDLLVKLEGTFPSDSAPKGYEVPKEVTVRVKLDGNTHHILLTAWEGDSVPLLDPPDPADPKKPDMSKAVQAELVARAGTAPTLDYNPGTRTGQNSAPTEGPGVSITKNGEAGTAAGAPMQWDLHWIRKGAVSS